LLNNPLTKQTMRITVCEGDTAAISHKNCSLIKKAMLEKLFAASAKAPPGTRKAEAAVLFRDSDMDEYVVLEPSNWTDFMEQQKKMLKVSYSEAEEGERDDGAGGAAPVPGEAAGGGGGAVPGGSGDGGVSASDAPSAGLPEELRITVAYEEIEDVQADVLQVHSSVNSWSPVDGSQPEVDSELIAINGVRVHGLKWQPFCALMLQRSRPMLLTFRRPGAGAGRSPGGGADGAREGDEDARFFNVDHSLPQSVAVSASDQRLSNIIDDVMRGSDVAAKELINKRDIFRYETFESKYNHPLAKAMKKKVESIISSYLSCDWVQAVKKGTGSPQATVLSLYRYIEAELSKLGLLNSKLPQGGGVPAMDDIQLAFLRGHIEAFIMDQVGECTMKMGPIGGTSESYSAFLKSISNPSTSSSEDPADPRFHFRTLSERLAFLGHLCPHDLGFGLSRDTLSGRVACDNVSTLLRIADIRQADASPENASDAERFAEEWYVAIRELTRACTGTKLSPSEIVHRFHTAVHVATLAAERYYVSGTCRRLQTVDIPVLPAASPATGGAACMESPAAFLRNYVRRHTPVAADACPPTFGADELLPIVTWLLIQANPSNIETVMWYCSEFRHPDLSIGHTNYSLAQLSSALEFVKTAGPRELCATREGESSEGESIEGASQTRELSARLTEHNLTLKLLEGCKSGEEESVLKQLIDEGADINGYSPDKKDIPISAAVRYRQIEVLKFLLQYSVNSGTGSGTSPPSLAPQQGPSRSVGRTQTQTRTRAVLDVDTPLNPLYAGSPPYCTTCLHLAVRLADAEAVLRLLRAGANRYACDSEGNTPLSLAVDFNHSDIQKLLVADPRLCSMVSSVLQGSVATVEGLLQQGLDATAVDPAYAMSPVMAAVARQSESLLALLLGHMYNMVERADFLFTTLDAEGLTALMLCTRRALGSAPQLHAHTEQPPPPAAAEPGARGSSIYLDSEVGAWTDPDSDDVLRMRLAVRLLNAGADGSFRDANGIDAFVHALLEGFVEAGFAVGGYAAEADLTVTPPRLGSAEAGAGAGAEAGGSGSGGKSVWAFMQSAASDILGTAASVLPRSDSVLTEADMSDPRARLAVSVVKSIDCAEQKYGKTQLASWCGYPRLAAALCYTPRTHRMYHCARDNCFHGVRALLDHGEDPNARCPVEDYTSLIAAVYNDNAAIFHLLIADARLDLDLPRVPSKNMTALHFAACAGNSVMCGKLLWAGADRGAKTSDGKSALDLAAEHGCRGTADVLRFDPVRVSIALAAKHGDIRVTKALLLQGVTLNTRRKHFSDQTMKNQLYTPLIAASTYGQIEYINYLLDESEKNEKRFMNNLNSDVHRRDVLDPDLGNPEGHTALMCAAMMGHEGVVLLLLGRARADRDAFDRCHISAAEWARRRGFAAVFDILRYDPVRCSIHAFISSGNLEATIALFKQKVNPNEKYVSSALKNSTITVSMSGVFDGESPLAVAARLVYLCLFNNISFFSLDDLCCCIADATIFPSCDFC
jgi:ankyrin repeat protein